MSSLTNGSTLASGVADDHGQPTDGAFPTRFGAAGPEQLQVQRPAPPGALPPGRRRRWPWALAGVLTAAALSFGAFAAGRATAPVHPPGPPTNAVVVLARPVGEGQTLGAGDLAAVTLLSAHRDEGATSRLPPGLSYFPASMRASLIGRQIRSALPAGTLLVPAELASGPFPGPGQALVGLDLQPSEAPSGGALVAGDPVGVLFVPAASQPPYPAPRPLVTAEVVASVAGQSGNSYVTVLVPARLAARLAAYAQHDEVALVRLGAGVVWPPPNLTPPTTAQPATAPPTTARPAISPRPRPTTAPPATSPRPRPRPAPARTTRPTTGARRPSRRAAPPAAAAHHQRTSHRPVAGHPRAKSSTAASS
jgi:hypothetical protein